MALANTSGGSYDKNTIKNDNGTVLNAGNTGDSRLGNDLNVSDNSNSQGQSLKPVEKDGTAGSTTDSAGVAKASSSQPFAKNSSPSEWKMFGGNVASELQYRDYSGSVNDGATEVARGQVETRVYGSGELSEFNILSRPDTQISTGRTKSANAGQSAKFVAPKTGADLTSSDFRPSRSNPGKINWNLGGIPQSVNYASKERGEFELPATPAGPAPVLRFTVKAGGTTTFGNYSRTVSDSELAPFVIYYVSQAENDNDVDFTVDWGDGNSDVITETPSYFVDSSIQTNVDRAIGHEYAQTGVYNISISGKYDNSHLSISRSARGPSSNVLYNNVENCTLLSVEDWGGLKLDYAFAPFIGIGPNNRTFVGNLFGDVSVPLFTTLPSGAPEITVSSLAYLFANCTSFNSPINNWDTSSITDMQSIFFNTLAFNQPLDNWDTSNVTSMAAMFYSTYFVDNFTDNVNAFPVGTLLSFDQDISSWDFSGLTNSNSLAYFGGGLNLSPVNYDALLIRWAEQAASIPAQSNVLMGTSRYSAGSAAATARATLINTYGWTITDGGAV